MKIIPYVLIWVLASTGAVFAAERDPAVRSITTNGVAEQEFAPDRVHLTAEIMVESQSRKESGEAVDRAHQRVVAAMKEAGVADRDVMLHLRRTDREYDYDGHRREFRGYSCTEDLEIVVRALDRLTRVMELLAEVEDVDLKGMRFESSREAEVKRETLLQASKAAREKAALLAKDAGVKLKELLEFSEGWSNEEGRGWYVNGAVGNFSGSGESTHGVGTKHIVVTVTVRYAIE